MFGAAEEVHHVSKPVADQAFGPKHRILISDGQRRVVGTSQPTLVGFLVFDLVERLQPPGGIEFELVRPARKALVSCQGSTFHRSQVNKIFKVNKALVFHRARLLVDCPPRKESYSRTSWGW